MIASLVWFSAFLGGTVAFLHYEFTPGDSTVAPLAWPEEVRLAPSADSPTLILFAHPHCPCTRASLDELSAILARTGNKVRAYVAFVQLAEFREEDMRGESWEKAGRIPGLIRLMDVNGAEAHRFGAVTSGYTVLYDERGRLIFDGGITGSRGQAGVNAGRVAVLDLLRGEIPAVHRTKAYGCAIFDRPIFDKPVHHGQSHSESIESPIRKDEI